MAQYIEDATGRRFKTAGYGGRQGPAGPAGPQGERGERGEPGENGVSPTVSTEAISGGHQVIIKDATHTETFPVMDGKDGAGSGDMLASVYDPQGKHTDIFAYVDKSVENVHVDMDNTPQQGSKNAVESGGVYAALEGKASTGYVDSAVSLKADKSAVVSSFKGRTGGVTPQAGDYTADMVSARPDTWTPTAAEVGAIPNTTIKSISIGTEAPLSLADGELFLVYEYKQGELGGVEAPPV